ncbi:uncharacterized protein BX664DRAFT_303026 [Halteromyces radiatus]|uniref:uncharacterized protein n=1 Tax=Halteromyces radiatus TaxID=101107 RepID=UPI002220B479|nr:uncharacterized protein BX664DRAFT_303026 [Halteromyces radiatus]KAI8079892.1 hypothetical protein BX664DRAFT_303026 [Halteromyces radiatus]
MLYCEVYNDTNVEKLNNRLKEMGDVVICYVDDNPMEPFILPIQKQSSNPFRYHLYSLGNDNDMTDKLKGQEDRTVESPLVSDTMIKTFLDEVFLPHEPFNDNYQKKLMTMHGIMEILSRYTTKFDEKSNIAFARWCTQAKVSLLNAEVTRKTGKGSFGSKIRYRTVFVLKDELIDDVVKAIKDYIPNYQAHIKNLKEDGFQIIGYCRKSRTNEDDDTRLRLLQDMINRLKQRSLVDKVFVSPYSSAGENLNARDAQTKFDIHQLKNASGTTQDLISYLAATKKVCMVVLDFAGLTTNVKDLKQWLCDNPNLENIIIDQLPIQHKIKIFNRAQLLNDVKTLELFNCRTGCVQRAKKC